MDSDHTDDRQPREHRAGAWILLVVGLIAIGLAVFQFRQSIFAPFARTSDFQTESDQEQARLDELKTKDTDQDGINDFDETYVFNTSPYLDDSDSDGFTDKEELESGNDPNCPQGKECGPLGDGETASGDAVFSTEPVVDTSDAELEFIDSMLNPTPDQIRQMLIDNGVSEDQVNALDDDTLTALYQESLQEAQSNSSSSTSSP